MLNDIKEAVSSPRCGGIRGKMREIRCQAVIPSASMMEAMREGYVGLVDAQEVVVAETAIAALRFDVGKNGAVRRCLLVRACRGAFGGFNASPTSCPQHQHRPNRHGAIEGSEYIASSARLLTT